MGVRVEPIPVPADPRLRTEFDLGRRVIETHPEQAFDHFTLARWACLPFTLLAGYLCYRWALELYGPSAGLLAAALWCFCPNVLANAQMITPDTAAAAFGLAAEYCFWRWQREPDWTRALVAGLALGLAEQSKLSWMFLFALWPGLWIAGYLGCRGRRPRARELGQVGLMLAVGIGAINAGYGFENCGERLGRLPFISAALTRSAGDAKPQNRFAATWLGGVPVPLPRNYLMGIDVQKNDFEQGLALTCAGSGGRVVGGTTTCTGWRSKCRSGPGCSSGRPSSLAPVAGGAVSGGAMNSSSSRRRSFSWGS